MIGGSDHQRLHKNGATEIEIKCPTAILLLCNIDGGNGVRSAAFAHCFKAQDTILHGLESAFASAQSYVLPRLLHRTRDTVIQKKIILLHRSHCYIGDGDGQA